MKTVVKRTTGLALSAAGAALALVGGQAATATAADGAPAERSATAAQGEDASRAATTIPFTVGGSGPGFAVDGKYTPRGSGCEGGPTDPCGIVYNRHGHSLQIARDSSSHWSCSDPKHFRDLPSGKNSNTYSSPNWPDVDCFRDKKHWIFTNSRPYPPGEWIRVWTAKWVY